MRIVFMGTPDFAATCLRRLVRDNHTVVAALCQPDKPKGRGLNPSPPPVKLAAQELLIEIYQPTTLRDGSALKLLEALKPDLMVVVAYGKLLPPDILALPQYGCVNLHASLLPKLRGAAPIQWSIISGDTVTGVTTMYMDVGMDTGDIILQQETAILPTETSGELFERLSFIGADCLSQTIGLIEEGNAPRTPQDESLATYAPMIEKSLGNIDFNKTPTEIVNLIRGLAPSPCGYTHLEDRRIKVLSAVEVCGFSGLPGKILDNKRFVVGCGGGAVEFITVQPQGKKVMDGTAFIRGLKNIQDAFCLTQSE